MDEKKKLVEISTVPDQIDRKSKDMISWFPIFFPLKASVPHIPKNSGGLSRLGSSTDLR
jgi:hypothetical protein